MTAFQITTRPAQGMLEVLDCYAGATKDIIIATRELCSAIAAGEISHGKVSSCNKDVTWSVEVRK